MKDKTYVFNYARNRDKLFANLIGIIDGVMADGVVKDEEILYLDTWLLEANQIINNGVIKGLSSRVSGILADGIVTDEEREELKNHLDRIQKEMLDMPDVDLFSTETDIHLLSGLCKGLIADRELGDDEVSLFTILCKCLFSEVTVQAVTELDNKAAHRHSPVLQRHRPFL